MYSKVVNGQRQPDSKSHGSSYFKLLFRFEGLDIEAGLMGFYEEGTQKEREKLQAGGAKYTLQNEDPSLEK